MRTISVSNLSPTVTEKDIETFFSFCGKIESINKPANSTTATVVFEKETAAKTATLLTDTVLGGSKVTVTATDDNSTDSPENLSETKATKAKEGGLNSATGDVPQEEKPKSAIIAEILSHGYVLSDKALTKSTEFDKEHGLTEKFNQFLQNVDSKYHISSHFDNLQKGIDKSTAQADEKFKIRDHVEQTKAALQKYFDRAMDNEAGSKVRDFYNGATKSANDIQNEARRLADMREGKNTADTAEIPEAGGKAAQAFAEPAVSQNPSSVKTTL
ncbi:hypothetical protein V1511DRAFT_489015 [Dipodascopsis uninucleata]